MIEIVSSFLLVFGSVFTLLASVGIVRFPDVYNRLHSATKSATLGVSAVLLASAIFFTQHGSFSIHQLAAILFLFISSPVAAHMIARGAYFSGEQPWEGTIRDDLKHD